VRYHKIRGNLEPLIECSNKLCKWTVDQLIPENSILAEDQKPKWVSTRQWFEATGVAGRC